MPPRPIFLDLTDLVTSLLWHGGLTGIQRVQIGVGQTLSRSGTGICISLFEGRMVVLNDLLVDHGDDFESVVDGIRTLYRKHYARALAAKSGGGRAITFRLRRFILRPFHKLGALLYLRRELKACDILVSAGAYWQLPYLIDIYRTCADRGVRLVGVVHDIFWIRPGIGSAATKARMQAWLDLPSKLIAVSNYTRSEVLEAKASGDINVKHEDVRLAPLAHEFPGASRNAILPRPERLTALLDDADYVLVVGSGPRKNHPYIREVWRELGKRGQAAVPRLVFAGQSAEGMTGEDFEIFLPSPSEQELAGLYANCLFSFFPSLIEGWGLPVGESLWFGRPCIASNTSSLPEVGGDLCLYVDPGDVGLGVAAVIRLLDAAERRRFEDRIRAAPLRTWDDTARLMTDAIHDACAAFEDEQASRK